MYFLFIVSHIFVAVSSIVADGAVSFFFEITYTSDGTLETPFPFLPALRVCKHSIVVNCGEKAS